MKIAVVSKTFGFRGGIERYAFDLARSLRTCGHEVTLVYGEEKGRDADDYAGGFSDVVPFRRAPERNFDVVYVQNSWDPDDLQPFGRTPIVFAAHDHDHTCVRRHRYLPFVNTPCHAAPGAGCVVRGCCVTRDRGATIPVALRSPFALQKRLARLSERGSFVACSSYVAERLVEGGAPRDRVTFVHPIPPEDDVPLAPLPASSNIAIVAQLIRGKGVDIAIEALKWLPSDVTLTVAGQGPSHDELVALGNRVANGRVRMLGYVRPDDVRKVYDEARAVVVPSRWPEPFGLIGVEAMRRARPVVAAAHGGIVEWLPEGRGGKTFEPGDPRALAAAIRDVLRDEGAGVAARAHALARFRHQDALKKLESVLVAAASVQSTSFGRRAVPSEKASPATIQSR
ncbi:MAG: glycosyltransferase family 4 protein [Polyangiaceae bacterium]|nr:glycosyltransferase family 4 protein [Polyangiaceae bacterium]